MGIQRVEGSMNEKWIHSMGVGTRFTFLLTPPTIYPGSIPEAQKRKHTLGEETDFF
jgi:hypothetical protein